MTAYQLFRKIDKNGNGSVTRKELAQFIKQFFDLKLTKTKMDIILTQCDENSDNQIDVKEFLDFIKVYDAVKLL